MVMPEKDAEYIGWFIDWREDYSQFFRKDNWFTFVFFQLEFENDTIMGGWEITFMLLGLGFRLRRNHTETKLVKEVRSRIVDVKNDLGL